MIIAKVDPIERSDELGASRQIDICKVILFAILIAAFPRREDGGGSTLEKRPRSCRSTAKKVSVVGHAVARRHEHRRISFCARGIIMAEEEAEPECVSTRRTNVERWTWHCTREKERKGVRERASELGSERERRGWKRKRKEDGACSLARPPTHFYLVFFILDETNDVHKSIDPSRLSLLISLFQVTLETRIRLGRQLVSRLSPLK